MVDLALKPAIAGRPVRDVSAWDRLKVNRDWLGLWFMLPTAAFLLLFLAYPLGLGVWLSFTDARIGRLGEFVGLENYEWLWDDSVFWLSVFNTLLFASSIPEQLPGHEPASARKGYEDTLVLRRNNSPPGQALR